MALTLAVALRGHRSACDARVESSRPCRGMAESLASPGRGGERGTGAQRQPSQPSQAELVNRILEVKAANTEFGIKRVHSHLRDEGWLVSEKRVKGAMQELGLTSQADVGGPGARSGRDRQGKSAPTPRASVGTLSKETMHVVGPDYMQVLRGRLFGKEVALILCGEAHEDAIDVTRKDGFFLPQEGFVDSSVPAAAASILSLLSPRDGQPSFKARVLGHKANVSMQGARGWGCEVLDEDDTYEQVNESSSRLFLLFFPGGVTGKGGDGGVNARGKKGSAFLVLFSLCDDDGRSESGEEGGSDSSDDGEVDRIENPKVRAVAAALLARVQSSLAENMQTQSEAASANVPGDDAATRMCQLAEWVDTDEEAREVNRRRLREARVSGSHTWAGKLSEREYDAIIERRKLARERQNIFTWDAWLDRARACTLGGGAGRGEGGGLDMHVILEAPIVPWEVELKQPPADEDLVVPAAAECVRCLSEDSLESSVDAEVSTTPSSSDSVCPRLPNSEPI